MHALAWEVIYHPARPAGTSVLRPGWMGRVRGAPDRERHGAVECVGCGVGGGGSPVLGAACKIATPG
eukprot:6455040-Amphidinium_carterae.2